MFLAIRELRHGKFRYLLIGCIMLLVSWLTFIVSGLANGLALDNASAMKNIKGDYVLLQKQAEQKLARSVLPPTLLEEVQQHAKQAAPLTQTTLTLTTEKQNKKIDVTVFGTEADSILMPTVTEGKSLGQVSKQEVIADVSLKENGVKIGDILKNEDSGIQVKIIGFAKGQMFSHMPVLYTDNESFQNLMKLTGKQTKPSYNAIVIEGTPNIKKTLETKISDVEVITKEEATNGIPGYKEEQGSLTMMITFLVIIAAFVQAVFFYVITLQKTNQFGILKAIGAKTSYLAKNLIGQVLLLASGAVIVSILLTFGTSALLPASIPFELNGSMLLQYSGLLITVAVGGALLSLRRIAKIDAIEAIGRMEV
ncbi:ABC transporter permease [Ectobacillus sp. JY-23]|uniref:ABC transporter permease n=1 Tax=Ectobacillus sp. JY-23 TaxID=2933872 RepID=UPI001FF15744|nr:ABC transporter permease [Ectobacillus sp. JY-23]UOY93029.1 ABC transporter permease [Ectobacillus sp. JY-23]